MNRLPTLFIIVFGYSAAVAQVGKGTVVVFNFTKSRLVVAADSRALFADRPAEPDDSQCKIAVFNHETVFATVGSAVRTGSIDSWTNQEIARKAVSTEGSEHPATEDFKRRIEDIAEEWGSTIASNWQRLYRRYPMSVVKATDENGIITGGFFAEVHNGNFYSSLMSITLSRSNLAAPVQFQAAHMTSGPSKSAVAINMTMKDLSVFMRGSDSPHSQASLFTLLPTQRWMLLCHKTVPRQFLICARF